MATARFPLFSREARGKIAGLSLSHRSGLGQVIRRWAAPPDRPSSLQRIYRARHALLTLAWQSTQYRPYDHYCWDRLRRYEHRPGTGYTRFLTDYIPIMNATQNPIYCHTPTVYRSPGVPLLTLDVWFVSNPTVAWCSYGPTPTYPSTFTELAHQGGGYWSTAVVDRWPGKRVFARFSGKAPGPTLYALSGLAATTHNG